MILLDIMVTIIETKNLYKFPQINPQIRKEASCGCTPTALDALFVQNLLHIQSEDSMFIFVADLGVKDWR